MPGQLICFVCGSPGAQTTLQTRQNDREPYFPFLIHHDPPKGARMATPDGAIDSCAVCYMFLTQQWDSYERSKTPAVKRLYWLKRSDNGNFTGAEMRLQGEYIAQVMGLQYPPGVDGRGSPEPMTTSNLENDVPERTVSNSNTIMYGQPYKEEPKKKHFEKNPKSSILDLSTSKKGSHFNSSSRTPSNETEEKAVCYICGKRYAHTNDNFINALDQGSREPFFPMLEKVQPFPGAEYMSHSGQVKGCTQCKNVLFQQWQAYEMSGTPLPLRTFKTARDANLNKCNDIKYEKCESIDSVSYHCYICGNPCISNQVRLLNTLPPKRPSPSTVFFPFVRELNRPSGAEPLRSDGTVIVCIKCYDHLSYQWEIQETGGVPVYHRQYSLQFLSNKPGGETLLAPKRPDSPPSECDEQIEPLNIHISSASPRMQSNQSSGANFQQGLLAIASETDSNLSGSPVKSCDILTDSRLSSTTEANPSSISKTVPHPLQQVTAIPKRVCFLCSEKCIINKMKQLSSYPARHEAKHTNAQIDPFFPFLANCNPAAGADPLTEDGTVIVCKLCYYSLLKQWTEFEHSVNASDSNRWLRKYSLPDYVCYVCAVENERKMMRSIAVKNFNFLRDHKAPKGSLFIDDGQRVVVCKSCAYSLMKQFTEYDRMGAPHNVRKFNWIQKNHYQADSEEELQFGTKDGNQMSSAACTTVNDENDEGGDISSQQGPLGSKPPPLNIMSQAGPKQVRNTATVSPLHHVTSPTNGVNSLSGNGSRTSSFAAALRKLANQAKDPPDESSKASSQSTNSRNTTTTKSSSSGPPPPMYTSRTLTSPPVVTIAPTQSHPSILASDTRPTLERLHSNSSVFETVGGKHDRPHSSASRDEDRAYSRDNHSQSVRRMTPHSTPGATSPQSAREEPLSSRGFQPYRPGDEMRHPLPSSLAIDQAAAAAAAAYSYPAFLPPHAFPHPAFRFDDPLLLERYRMMQSPYLPYPQSMLGHPSLHPLLAAGVRYPPDMFPPPFTPYSQPGRMSEHRSPSMLSERHEEKQREFEREREERERERDLAVQRERQKVLERETEKRKDRERLAQQEHDSWNNTESRDRHDHSTSSISSMVHSRSTKGLGIADRYPRLSPMASTSSTSVRKEEHRPVKDEHHLHRRSSHKESSSESEKRYSLVNPLLEREKPPRVPIMSPRSHDDPQSWPSKVNETGLFRPFDSQQVVNGFSNEPERRDDENFSSQVNKSHIKHSDQHSLDRKVHHRQKNSDSSSNIGTSAFHKLSNMVSRPEHEPSAGLHSVSKEINSGSLHGTVYSAPLNVPAYSMTLLQSNVTSNNRNMEQQDGESMRAGSHKSPNCVSKIDMEERRKSESRAERSVCSDSECDESGGDEDWQERKLLISSGPPLKLDTSPKKIKLLSELGLTTFSHKKDAEFERWRKRRRRMKERSVSPVSVVDGPQTPLKTPYNPDDLCREPDFKKKCHFLSRNCHLELVPAENRKVNQTIYQAVEEEKKRRRYSTTTMSASSETNTGDSSIFSREKSAQAKDSVKMKLEDDYDDVFNFSAQESKPVVTSFDRPLSGTSTSIGKLATRSSIDFSEKIKWEPSAMKSPRPNTLSKSFAHEFHESVLQTTRQKELLHVSGDAGRQFDLSPQSGHHLLSPCQPDPSDPWPGLDVVLETYERHAQGEKIERQVLQERHQQLRAENSRLNMVCAQLKQRMDEMVQNKSQLEELRNYNQECIDSIKSSIRKLK